jgi:integrase/recombinase XerD
MDQPDYQLLDYQDKLTLEESNSGIVPIGATYQEAKKIMQARLFKKLEKSFSDEVEEWLKIMEKGTAQTYKSAMNTLYYIGLIDPFMSLGTFSTMNHEEMIDKIKKTNNPWKEETRQLKAASLISFLKYLARKYPGAFRRVEICETGISKTFYKTTEKCKTPAMTRKQWEEFLYELSKINHRDYLIAALTLQGAKRISEVLTLQIGQVYFDDARIHFVQSKTMGLMKYTVITYPRRIMDLLAEHIGERKEGRVFNTSTGNQVSLIQVSITFSKAGKRAEIPFPIHPHVLRTSAVTYLKEQGYTSDDIMKITGHSTTAMVNFYDKSDMAKNPTKEISLV